MADTLESIVFAFKYRLMHLAQSNLCANWYNGDQFPRLDVMLDRDTDTPYLVGVPMHYTEFTFMATLLRPILFTTDDPTSLKTLLSIIKTIPTDSTSRLSDAGRLWKGFLKWQKAPIQYGFFDDDEKTPLMDFPWDIQRFWGAPKYPEFIDSPPSLSKVDELLFPNERYLTSTRDGGMPSRYYEMVKQQGEQSALPPEFGYEWKRLTDRLYAELFHSDIPNILAVSSDSPEQRMWTNWGMSLRIIRGMYFVNEAARLVLDCQKLGLIGIHDLEKHYEDHPLFLSAQQHTLHSEFRAKSLQDVIDDIGLDIVKEKLSRFYPDSSRAGDLRDTVPYMMQFKSGRYDSFANWDTITY